jgi:hypothetical protein
MRSERREAAKRTHASEKRRRERQRKFMAPFTRKENRVSWDFSTPRGRLTYINSHLKACKRCGETDYRVLSFHHRDRRSKKWNVKSMVQGDFTKRLIDEEIAKCDTLCMNCHRLTHWELARGIDSDHMDSG